MEVGVELLESGGLAALSLRRIATAAGVSHGAPRHHFPTYAGLLAAIARAGVEELDRSLAPCFADPDPAAGVRRAARAYLDFATARPEMFELIARHDLLEGAGGRLREITARWYADLAGALARLWDVSPVSVGTPALALWSGVHGLAVLVTRRTTEAVSDRPDPTAALDHLLDTLLAAPPRGAGDGGG